MEIDVRDKGSLESIDVIRYSSKGVLHYWSDFVYVSTGDNAADDAVIVGNKEDALSLIKALEKAIELKWFDK
jgi:hypothetical protein